MRKFLVTFWMTGFVFSSGVCVFAQGLPGQPDFKGITDTTVDVTSTSNSALGTETKSEIKVGSVLSGDVTGNLTSSAKVDSITSSSDGVGTEANITIGSIGE
ncbi:MAG: hypothetical protein ACE5FU_04435 [Nitrospinota bacterium]